MAEINAPEEERNTLVTRFRAVNSFSNIGSLSVDLRLCRVSTASNCSSYLGMKVESANSEARSMASVEKETEISIIDGQTTASCSITEELIIQLIVLIL
jgi:hypothetical protein